MQKLAVLEVYDSKLVAPLMVALLRLLDSCGITVQREKLQSRPVPKARTKVRRRLQMQPVCLTIFKDPAKEGGAARC